MSKSLYLAETIHLNFYRFINSLGQSEDLCVLYLENFKMYPPLLRQGDFIDQRV